jgi:flagellar FliJ protein
VPRFRFALQAVLDHREMIEQQKQKAVAELESRRLDLEALIRSHQRTIAHERAEQRTLLEHGRVMDARAQAASTVRISALAQRAVLELSGVHARLQAARAELLEAAKRRKAVELLKERRFEQWKLEQNRREAAALDELSVMQAARKELRQEPDMEDAA